MVYVIVFPTHFRYFTHRLPPLLPVSSSRDLDLIQPVMFVFKEKMIHVSVYTTLIV